MLLTASTDSAGLPIAVEIHEDEAVISTGHSATCWFTCAESGDELHLVEVVEAIMDGGATEYAFMDSEDVPLLFRFAVVGTFGEYSFDTTNAVYMRKLPAWSSAQATE